MGVNEKGVSKISIGDKWESSGRGCSAQEGAARAGSVCELEASLTAARRERMHRHVQLLTRESASTCGEPERVTRSRGGSVGGIRGCWQDQA